MSRAKLVDFEWQDTERFETGFDHKGKVVEVNLKSGYVVIRKDNTLTNIPEHLMIHLNMKTLKQLHQLACGISLSKEVHQHIESLISPDTPTEERARILSKRPTSAQLQRYVIDNISDLERRYLDTDREYLIRTKPKKEGFLDCEGDVKEAYLIGSKHYSIIPSVEIREFFDRVLTPRGLLFVREEVRTDTKVLVYAFPGQPRGIQGRDSAESFSKFLAVMVGRNDGTLSIRVYFGVEVLSCTNQLYFARSGSNDNSIWLRIAHYERKTNPLERIQVNLESAFTAHEQIYETIGSAMNRPVIRHLQQRLLDKLKEVGRITEKMHEKITARLASEGETLWGITQAMTYVGTHDTELTDKQKTHLITYGGRILQHWNSRDDLSTWEYTDFTESSGAVDDNQATLIGEAAR